MITQNNFHDTIFALSSGKLPSGVAVIRVSGPQTRFVTETIAGRIDKPRITYLRKLYGNNGDLLDTGLVIYFEGPASFTGEDCSEFHLHGGIAVVERFLTELGTFENVRLAEAGEFSRRAFTNGKMDLTVSEGLADLISAETESQRRLALQGASGKQRELYSQWRNKIIQARALIEAELDFSDEGDVPGSVSEQVWNEMTKLSQDIKKHLDLGQRANFIRDGFHVVIIGAPNAGKSSLLNYLSGRDIAIISDEAGTTRDLLEVHLNLSGNSVYMTDTAGIRNTANKVERLGIQKALDKVNEADLVLLLEDISAPDLPNDKINFNTSAEIIKIGTKLDLNGQGSLENYDFCISTADGKGINELLAYLTDLVTERTKLIGDAIPTRLRHIQLLQNGNAELIKAITLKDYPLELRAENLRIASQHLGRITGDIDVEDILDVIFSEFCIGK